MGDCRARSPSACYACRHECRATQAADDPRGVLRLGPNPGHPLRVRRLPAGRHDRRIGQPQPHRQKHPSRPLCSPEGSAFLPLGPDDGVATIGDTVRYPDAVITCTRTLGTSYLVERPVIVFEVISPGNSAIDRITKVREYLAVASIHTYVIVEQSSIGLTVLRRHDDNSWITTTLTAEDVLRLHEPEVEIPVPELYENVDLPDAENRSLDGLNID